MLTVACICVPGGIYEPSHAYRLKDMVSRHLALPHRFVLIDRSQLPGWWAKIELFMPGRFQGRVLYLDLDVTVVGPLDDLATYPYPFVAIKDYQYPLTINSSVMAWDAGVADHIYTDFKPDVMDRLRGDQNWIHERQRAMTFPRRWCPSYKKDVLPTGKLPDDARVCVFHGDPRPWDVAPL